jgi:hypothetical protein
MILGKLTFVYDYSLSVVLRLVRRGTVSKNKKKKISLKLEEPQTDEIKLFPNSNKMKIKNFSLIKPSKLKKIYFLINLVILILLIRLNLISKSNLRSVSQLTIIFNFLKNCLFLITFGPESNQFIIF